MAYCATNTLFALYVYRSCHGINYIVMEIKYQLPSNMHKKGFN